MWVWLRCVWRNLAGCGLGDYVAKNGNVTKVTYVCQSFVRHPRLKVTRVDRGTQETPDTDTESDEDDGWGWGVNLAKPAGEVTVAQRRTTSVHWPTWTRIWRSWCVQASAPSGARTNAV